MAQLGNQNTGDFFTVSGTYNQFAGLRYTVPSPGIIVSALHAYAMAQGSSSTARLYVWRDSVNNWLIRSGQFSLGTGAGWVNRTDLTQATGSDLYIPAGTVINIGLWVQSADYEVWGSGTGQSIIGTGGDGNFSFSADVGSGFGQLAGYLDYTPLPAPTISGISPSVAPPGSPITITGTGLLHASGVTIGGVAASFTVVSDTSITATVPSSGVGGAVTVTVTTPAGNASSTITAGQIYVGASIAAIKAVYANPGGTGIVPIKAIWVSNGSGGVKRIW